MAEKRKFGGAQENAGRKVKSPSGKQTPVSFGASPACIEILKALTAPPAGKKKGLSKGEVICAALHEYAAARGLS